MIRECCYCVKELGKTVSRDATHGICARHYRAEMSKLVSPEALERRMQNIRESEFCPDLRHSFNGNETL